MEKKKEIYNEIMELETCLLYAPECIPYTSLKAISLNIFRKKNFGPKRCERFAVILYDLYIKTNELRKENPNSVQKKSGEALTLKNVIDSYNNNMDNKNYDGKYYIIYRVQFSKIREVYAELFNCISEKEVCSYIRKEAKLYLEEAFLLISNKKVTRKKNMNGFESYLEWLYYNLKSELESKGKFCIEKVYRLNRALKKEISLNKEVGKKEELRDKPLIEIDLNLEKKDTETNDFDNRSTVYGRAYSLLEQLKEMQKEEKNNLKQRTLMLHINLLENRIYQQQMIDFTQLEEIEEVIETLKR